MVRNHRNQPQAILFLAIQHIKRGGLNRCPYNPPWPLAHQPFRTLFDCCIVVVCDQVAWLHLAMWSQNCCALNPSQPKKWTKSPHITKAAMPSSGRFQPKPHCFTFDGHVFRDCDRADCSIKTARSKNEGDPTTPPPNEYCRISLLDAEPLRLPPAVRAHTPAHTD